MPRCGRRRIVTSSLLKLLIHYTPVAKRYGVRKNLEALQSQLGVTVRRLRRKLGITQEELAWRANMHRTYLADIERGGRNITLKSIGSLADALQLPIDGLLRGEDPELANRPGEHAPSLVGEVLLVEDSALDAALTLRVFQRARFTNPVKVVADGEEAIHALFGVEGGSTRPPAPLPELILLDLNLPKMSGIDVLRRIKADATTKDIPVVILTASRHDRDIIECGRLGAENYIIKPVSFESLCRVTPKLSLRWALLKPANGAEPMDQQDEPLPMTESQ